MCGDTLLVTVVFREESLETLHRLKSLTVRVTNISKDRLFVYSRPVSGSSGHIASERPIVRRIGLETFHLVSTTPYQSESLVVSVCLYLP